MSKPCLSCTEGLPANECPASKRPCGHHCDCSWTQDVCDWCRAETDDDGEMHRPTHYVLVGDHGAEFVKVARFFIESGGLRDSWGKRWKAMTASSLKDARQKAAKKYGVGKRALLFGDEC